MQLRIEKLTQTRKLGFKLPLKNSKSNKYSTSYPFQEQYYLGGGGGATFQRWLPNTPFPQPMAGMVNKLGHSFFPQAQA